MTPVALLSDVHANLVALEAVLAELDRLADIAGIWVMGDTAGYGPDPSDVLARLRERNAVMVAGNHDVAVGTDQDLAMFNPAAAAAAERHRTMLSRDERDFLAGLPRVIERDGVTLVHGSLDDPLWEYVFDTPAAAASLALATTPLSCHGHTHFPVVFRETGGELKSVRGTGTVALGKGHALVNPGSVGQPRDRDPRAAWAVLDPEARSVRFMRTEYDVAETQRRIRARGLPAFLATRLASGT